MKDIITSIKVWPLKNPHKTIKANGEFVIAEAFAVKFTLFAGKEGMFITLPGKYADNVTDENGRKKWYSDVFCLDNEVRDDLLKKVVKAYNETVEQKSMNQGEGPGPDTQLPF